jgi:hypothetical protein
MMMNAKPTSENPVAHLSAASLNARARDAASVVHKACISLRDPEVLAFEAARLGCAHLGHVEVLEAAATRAARMMAANQALGAA